MFLKSIFDHFHRTDIFFTVKILLPEKPISTPHKFVYHVKSVN